MNKRTIKNLLNNFWIFVLQDRKYRKELLSIDSMYFQHFLELLNGTEE